MSYKSESEIITQINMALISKNPENKMGRFYDKYT